MRHLGGESGKLSPSFFLPVLERVDIEVYGAVEVGQEVAEAGNVGQPEWPNQLSLI